MGLAETSAGPFLLLELGICIALLSRCLRDIKERAAYEENFIRNFLYRIFI